ncbi:ribosomal protein-like protein S15 [Bimuria novae-zelandiae CBS 107.79]|uniref:Ribosomal protein-like protein S15 n=1 Tax=Bimuria novae-zelandiae CBS 107.79 TaxID=1447943 RepID=A0A6A5UXX3_9PLEO|nr:ribosomal protein-like protein S15 [Bimuria novae-zelandiae CBS 107.79]
MPPRIPIAPCLRASKAPFPSTQFTLPFRPFSATAQGAAPNKKQQSRDPYILAEKQRKKASNLSRRADLEAVRVASLGDPVRGNSTPFVESFATATPLQWEAGKKIAQDKRHLNYAFDSEAVNTQLEKSRKVAVPLDELQPKDNQAAFRSKYLGIDYSNAFPSEEPQASQEDIDAQRAKDHDRATEAIKRITALENSSSKDRMRVNKARCVSTFGRHNTDKILPPRAPPLAAPNAKGPHPVRPKTNLAETAKRIGADTGSAEVQIAILTAKIKTLADFLETRGKGDKHNKRNLRLLVHRRQKMLQYLRRKERGGPRWQHCIETLGLTEGTWRGEISL